MRQICNVGKQDPGAVPGASTEVTQGNLKGIGGSTELSSVDSAKVMEGERVGGAQGTRLPPVGEGAKIPQKGEWVRLLSTGEVVQVEVVGSPDGEHRDMFGFDSADLTMFLGRLDEGRLWERVAPPTVEKPKRKRRTKAEMALTHGKNGVSELPAIPEKTPESLPVSDGDRVDDGEFGMRTEIEEIPEVRRCLDCEAFLGREVPGPRCSYCGENARCERLGCSRLTETPTSRYCHGHRVASEAVSAPVATREGAAAAVSAAFDAAWYALSESPDLDPVSVAACKRIRDAEVRS